MRRIILSLALIVVTGTALAVGATTAFFSDQEASVGNTFAAGAIDLKIDNESYYNGILNASTTWKAKDLTIEKFFDFPDLKPDDYGEDTISLHVDTNDAYMCANVKLTSNNDNGFSEPEALLDSTADIGELAGLVNFLWWADDGDNVLESDEKVISQGPISALGVGGSTTIALADSATNIWTGTPGPMPGEKTHYIGKAWCFGTLGVAKVPQDGKGDAMSPAGNNNGNGKAGEPEDGGVTCDGAALGNESQTDSLTADVTFTATQARHNPKFLCVPPVVKPMGKITVTKVVVVNNGGNETVSDFQLYVDDGDVSTQVISGVQKEVPAGNYLVTETGVPGYKAKFSGDCNAVGQITVGEGESKNCTITNTELPANITLIKNVTGTPPLASPTSFSLTIDGLLVQNNTSFDVTSNAPHIINEVQRTGYSFVSITGSSKCPTSLGGSVTLNEGESITCTITNKKN